MVSIYYVMKRLVSKETTNKAQRQEWNQNKSGTESKDLPQTLLMAFDVQGNNKSFIKAQKKYEN